MKLTPFFFEGRKTETIEISFQNGYKVNQRNTFSINYDKIVGK